MTSASPRDIGDDGPAILLLVGHTARRHGPVFESDGLWTASADGPNEALDTALELRPDAVIADAAAAATDDGAVLRVLKTCEQTHEIPIVLLGTAPPTAVAPELLLPPTVPPQVLLRHVRSVIAQSRVIRAQAAATRERVVAAAKNLHDRAKEALAEALGRACPGCGRRLQWLERGTLAGVDYDYYRSCERGCGMYCFDRDSRRWVKLT